MQGDMDVGGYAKKSAETSLATPRASTRVNVYRLAVDVFVFEPLGEKT